MAFLHERFPATRTHEVWGSHERVFKQVRTMFANAQRKARLAGGFIQSPGMPFARPVICAGRCVLTWCVLRKGIQHALAASACPVSGELLAWRCPSCLCWGSDGWHAKSSTSSGHLRQRGLQPCTPRQPSCGLMEQRTVERARLRSLKPRSRTTQSRTMQTCGLAMPRRMGLLSPSDRLQAAKLRSRCHCLSSRVRSPGLP